MVVGGEVGDGMFGDGYDGDGALMLDPFMPRCDDGSTALSAAPAGSRVCSAMEWLWVVCIWVGEDAALGGRSSMILLVEYLRDRLLLPGVPAVDGVGAGGDMLAS